MNTDKELLELAAKGAGLDVIYSLNGPEDDEVIGFLLNNYRWNPLADDGDALRLAVKLRLLVECGYLSVEVRYNYDEVVQWGLDDSGITETIRDFGGSNGGAEATRRAIVRAAAAIGRGMK